MPDNRRRLPPNGLMKKLYAIGLGPLIRLLDVFQRDKPDVLENLNRIFVLSRHNCARLYRTK